MNKPKSKLVKVPAQSLRIHPAAQRDIVPSKLKKLMADLDLDAIGVLHAVEYEIDGARGTWIIDGQHRWRALMEHGFGEWPVEVKIHLDASDDARASALFLKLNDRSPVSPYDKFVNEARAMKADAIHIMGIAEKYGLKVSRNHADGHLRCISALKKTYSIDSGDSLTKALGTVVEAWGKSSSSLEGVLIEGIGLIYGTFNGSVEKDSFVKRLSKYPGGPAALIGAGRGLREYRKASLSRCVAAVAIEKYNSGRRSGQLDPL